MKQKQRVHNEHFRPVSLGNRKSCPSCKEKLEPGESIWSWGEYRRARWYTVMYFCKNCFETEVKQSLVDHAGPCGCTIELNVRGEAPWLTLQDYRWASKEDWGIKYYPEQGGTEAHRYVKGIGWVVDTEDQMPPGVWDQLLKAVDAPIGQA